MEKVGEYWEPNFIAIKSSFLILAASLKQGASQSRCHFSSTCGLGWTFRATHQRLSTSAPSTNTTDSDSTDVYLYIYPHLLDQSQFKDITIRVEVSACDFIQTSTMSFSGYQPVSAYDPNTRSNTTTERAMEIAYFNSPFGQVLVDITVKFPTDCGLMLPSTLRDDAKQILIRAMSGADVADIKFYAYTRISSAGASHPQAVYSTASALKGRIDYLDSLLGDGFKESDLVDLDRHCLSQEDQRDESYDYESDSDLDDDETPVRDFFPSASTSTIVDSSNAEKKGDGDGLAPSRGRMGRIVVLKGKALKTWTALLFYLYTGQITFCPLSSYPQPDKFSSPDEPTCSAKSMYRLADEIGMEDLKLLAFKHIQANIHEANIVTEVFSRFSLRYPEILQMEVSFFEQHSKAPQVREMFQEKIEAITSGELPHSAQAMWMIWSKLVGGAVGNDVISGAEVGVTPKSKKSLRGRRRPY